MEWNTGDLIWFDPGLGHWLPGEVLECHRQANVLTVQALINGKPQTFALTDGEGQVRSREDLGSQGVEDMTQLSDLHEAALLWNLKLRYDRNLIYTYAGSILVAVNPYRMFDSSYGIEAAQRYRGRLLGSLPPHLFALGAAAHAALPQPQVVVISGESGSGKTESTKLVMQYLAAVAPSAPRGQALVTEQILEAAPLLEAFGNARTAKNDNSSRFGKYLEVYFKNGAIVGAKVTQYLLEKSRIVTQAPGERNYHVFYELIGYLSQAEKQKIGLVDAEKYFYLNQGGDDCSPGQAGSGSDWGALKGAMQVLGVGEAEQESIIKILASILHLGNIYFHRRQLRHGQEGVEIGSDAEIKWAAHLLQISSNGLLRALTTRVTEARAEKVHTPLGIDQALDARDAFAKALYSALFNWLVSKINSNVQRGGLQEASRISLLDIFGFEDLAENTFEQLCINFAAESLQLYFNKHVFKLEQQEYARERLEWTNLTWTDNTPVIHLLGKKPVGILHLLDDESNFPRASDASFLEKCHYNHALNEHYCRPRVGGREFGIRHYAGQVWYSVDGFLDKNRDALRPDILELLASSKEPLISAICKPLFAQNQSRTLPRGANGRFVTMKPRTPTVAARFSDSLQQLLESMSHCTPWFVRCIKPNNDKTPMRFDMPIVLQQLRYLGLLDTIKIRQSGYPIRLKFQSFVEQYRYLLPGILPRGAPYRDLCRAILDRMPHSGTEGPDYQLGASRVFLRESLKRQLEIARNDVLKNATLVIQKNIRGYLARKKFRNMKKSAVTIQKNWKGYKQRKNYSKVKKGVIKAQALYRGKLERKRFKQRKMELKRRIEAEKAAQERAAKQRQANAEREQRELREKQKISRTSVHNLEIPAELAFIFSKLESYTPTHTERNLVKVIGGITGSPPNLSLPNDLDQFAFGKFCSVYFKDAGLGMKREPITSPFLSKAASRDQDFQDSLALFKLILRWSNDQQLTGLKERALADFIVYKGSNSRGLKDELLVQLCNQAWKNENADRIWQLMGHCLSCFQPTPALSKYLLKFVTDHASNGYNTMLQRKLLRGAQNSPHTRSYPPSLIEWRSMKQRCDMALPLTLPDGSVTTVNVDSWTTCEEAATTAINPLGMTPEGWSVVLEDNGVISDCNGLDYVLDLVSELELCPAFPIEKYEILKAGTKRAENDHSFSSSPRPQVPPPEPPPQMSRKISAENQSVHLSSRKSSRDTTHEYSPQRESPKISSSPIRKSSHEVLSRNSALNERYFEVEKVRSRSLDNLLSNDPLNEPNPLVTLGLSQSRLNERYHSVEQLAPIEPVISKKTYMDKQELEFEYPDVSSVSTSHRGGPRYMKNQYLGKKAPPGSQSSRAQIEKSELIIRSSAMSDTSEAPSLASHVRRVRVPSQASDVDQFLDDLFSPVLEGNLDDLSDARSLAASIKGGRSKTGGTNKMSPTGYQNPQSSLEDLLSVEKLVYRIKGGGKKSETSGNQSSESDFGLGDLNAKELASKIKGGGNRNRSSSRSSSMLDHEVESLTSNQQDRSQTDNGNVDDYINNIFRPIFINDNLKAADKNGVEPLKNGTAAGAAGTSAPFPMVPGMVPGMLPLLASNPEVFSMLNIPGMNLQPGADLTGYQQNLQRAFLQSAMAQNIQIQQQLLAQNQALQTLLTQQVPNVDVKTVTETTVHAEVHRPPNSTSTPLRKSSFKTNNFSRKSSSPSSGSFDFKRKQSTESNISLISRNGGIPPPPPPPMPPDLEPLDPEGSRPFLDPYGRAKTVRIGKWRWPPPKDSGANENGEDFMQFKMRQQNRKVTPSRDQTQVNQSQADWEELDFDTPTNNPEKHTKSGRRSFEIGASRPSPGSIGKLKLSSEMKQRLEMVTANHSVRSSKEQPARTVNKLEDTRKLMLEQQLRGRWDSVDGSQGIPSGSPSPENLKIDSKSPTQQSWNSSSWRPVPPPPPIAPGVLPPAPAGPAPPPPIRPNQNNEPIRDSFMAQRQDRDTFGVHQNMVMHSSSKRNSFSANWEVNTSLTQEGREEVSNWAKDGMDNEKHDGRLSRESSNWDTSETNEIRHRNLSVTSNDRWDMEGRMERRNLSGSKENLERPTFRTHMMSKSQQEREKKLSVSTQNTDKPEKLDEWPEFMRPVKTPPPSKKSSVENMSPSSASKLLPHGAAGCVTYNRMSWTLRVRKEFFTPSENLGPPTALHLIFCQVTADVFGITPCVRLSQNERRAGLSMLNGYGVTAENITSPHRAHIKRQIIELARTWPLYFSRLFLVSGAAQLAEVQLVAVSHWGVHLVKRDPSNLRVIASISLGEIQSCTAPRPSTVALEGPQGRITLHTPRAVQLSEMVSRFCNEYRKAVNKATPPKQHIGLERSDSARLEEPLMVINDERTPIVTKTPNNHAQMPSPNSPTPPSGKHSLLQFAMQHFRQNPELEVLKMDSSLKSKEKRKEWTWKQQTDLVKWQGHSLEGPLLKFEDPELDPLAVECFDCILRYCGDLPLTPEMSEVKCVYTILMHCHKHMSLRDEVYCQLMKQTTSNKSESPESCQRAWRLLSIMAAYFACSETLKPYLTEHLSSAASDRRRVCHGTAAVCLSNLRKTQKCGGRKNVPSVEEVTAVSAGRSARRQIYRLPGGAERVVNTRCSTVVADVISELCSVIGVTSEAEQQEFSLYCIVQGDAFTMPLAADEYILDVTTELHKAAQPFYLIFCRSVWYHPLRHDASPLYTEVLFNQVAPDYLEGLLLKLGGNGLPPAIVRDMALVAALLHRAADLSHTPSLKEVKFLLPKPVLGLREPRPPQWLAMVQTSWGQAAGLQVSRAKHRVLQVLSSWPLFGSSFFAVKRVLGELDNWQEHILALNRNGAHFLDLNSHETLQHWPFAEVISTRKVRSEDGALFLDMKCGNLLQQRVTRLQTEQAHEISRLVRQYITLEQSNINRSSSQSNNQQ